MTLLNDADAIFIGDQAADAVYLGANKVWQKEAGFDPNADLVIWFDASQLALADGASLTAWPNLGTGPQPIIGAPSPKFRTNMLNGKPVVRFTDSEGYLRITNSGVHKDYTLVYVGRMWSANTGRIVCAAYPGSGNMLFGYWSTYMDVAYVTGGAGFFVPDTRKDVTTAWHLYSADCDTPAVAPRLFSDGIFLGAHPNPPAADGWGGSFNISGYGTSGEESCDCDVAEVLLYSRKLLDPERQQVEGHLRTKWGPL
jgi:hypothetical protein